MFPARIFLDGIALALLITCLAYWWLDNLSHELIGTSFFALLIIHNVFNRRWYAALPSSGRDFGRVINGLIILGMALSAAIMLITSLLISRDLFGFTAVSGAITPRTIHMFTGYWMLLFVGVHLGTRWQMVMSVCRKTLGLAEASALRRWLLRVIALSVAAKGVLSIAQMGFGAKLMWIYSMDMWDFNADASGFFLNYFSIVGFCTVVAHYAMVCLRKSRRNLSLGT